MSNMPLAMRRMRKSFGKIKKIVDMPDLISVQCDSYERFLQMDVPPDQRRDIGLQAVFKSVFPIKDFTGRRITGICFISICRSKARVFRNASTVA